MGNNEIFNAIIDVTIDVIIDVIMSFELVTICNDKQKIYFNNVIMMQQYVTVLIQSHKSFYQPRAQEFTKYMKQLSTALALESALANSWLKCWAPL